MKVTNKKTGTLKYNKKPFTKAPVLIATPTLGTIRMEWAHARFGQIIPINWGMSGFDLPYVAMGYTVADAYNVIVQHAIDIKVEWLLTVEDDVIIPPDCFVKMGRYIRAGDVPVVSGLYYLKSDPPEPLVFRGSGTGGYNKFKIGEKVWCDGLPMGCLLIHMSIIKYYHKHIAETYILPGGKQAKRVFETPQKIWYDVEKLGMQRQEGTQDLYFFSEVIKNKVLKKSGWKKIGKKKYPFLCDTSILCRHIDIHTGRMFPA